MQKHVRHLGLQHQKKRRAKPLVISAIPSISLSLHCYLPLLIPTKTPSWRTWIHRIKAFATLWVQEQSLPQGAPLQPEPRGTAGLTGALPSPRHSSAFAWLCTGCIWSFPCPISGGCGNQCQSSRTHLLASFSICTRSESCTPVYGVRKLDFIGICRDSHLFPHSLFAVIAALTWGRIQHLSV